MSPADYEQILEDFLQFTGTDDEEASHQYPSVQFVMDVELPQGP